MTDEGRLARWSRKKRAAQAGARDEAPAKPAPETKAPAPEAAPDAAEVALSDAEILAKLGLKDPDLLKKGDDFAAYLGQAVPEHLRRRALRRLWRSNPILANLDGLNDYDGDFTGGGVAPGALKTNYKVGRGFLRDAVAEAETEAPETEAPEIEASEIEASEIEASEIEALGTEPGPRTAAAPEPAAAVPTAVETAVESVAVEERDPEAEAADPEGETSPIRTARRIRFRFEG